MMGSMSRGTGTVLKHLYILPYLVGASLLFAFAVYAIGYFVPKFLGFDLKQRTATCFEVAVTNAALTMTIAIRHFNPLAVVVSIVYAKIMVMAGSIVLVPIFQRMQAREARESAARVAAG